MASEKCFSDSVGGVKHFLSTLPHPPEEECISLSLKNPYVDAWCAPEAMNLPGWRLHSLAGELEGHWAVKVNGNWRLTFLLEERDAVLVDYQDYH